MLVETLVERRDTTRYDRARKADSELQEGRCWLSLAYADQGILLKDKYESAEQTSSKKHNSTQKEENSIERLFVRMVAGEVVRLGESTR